MDALHRTEVDLQGLLEVLGKNLYSSPSVVVRELVQNAHDSCLRRQLEAEGPFEPRIRIVPEPSRGLLHIEDNGIGLTEDEVREFLATVGRGATGRLRRGGGTATEALIGQFGVGFLTAYVVSEQVTLETTSAQTPERGTRFVSRGGTRYSLSPIAPRPIGTRVSLKLAPEHQRLLDEVEEGSLVRDTFRLLPTPVLLGADSEAPINQDTPPWRLEPAPHPIRRRQLELQFASALEPLFEPLVCFRLPYHEGDGSQGLLWIQDGGSYLTSDHRSVSVYVRGMLVTHDARDLLPSWAGFAGAVVESRDLEITASREEIRKGPKAEHLAARIRACLVEGLEELARAGAEGWQLVLRRHGETLRGASVAEPRLFDALAGQLQVPTSEGELTLDEVVTRSPMRRLHLGFAHGAHGPESLLHRAIGVPVVDGTRYAAAPFVRRWCEAKQVSLVQLGTKDGDASAFPRVELPSDAQARLTRLFRREEAEVVPSRFAPASLPFLYVPDREAELAARLESDEADRNITSATLALARSHMRMKQVGPRARLFVNTSAPAIQAALEAGPKELEAARLLFDGLIDLLARDSGGDGLSGALERFGAGLCQLLAPRTETP